MGKKGKKWNNNLGDQGEVKELEIIINVEPGTVGQKDGEKWECRWLSEKRIAELGGISSIAFLLNSLDTEDNENCVAKISKYVYVLIIKGNRSQSWEDNEESGTEFIEDSKVLSWRSIAICNHWGRPGNSFIYSTTTYSLPYAWHTSVVNKNI